ncbi:hypothetical protein BSL82_03670 [Tardibacter chloracetimidivorans]|uniref:Uncharacterized protein n=1 Tax=Tardibacter chloracetimidivorans TaxID=1921510 RepID=A0A1L3ZSB7_9SPHN|nr:hypothetical protein [Tardibacter chloracetimidivorans]API58515.1 hypothetical protein BSL82_03670 [Tardibacter chloracetimidivorans]
MSEIVLTEEEEQEILEGQAASDLLDNPAFLLAIERVRGECSEGILTSPPDRRDAREDLYNLSRGLTAITEKLAQIAAVGASVLQNAALRTDESVQDDPDSLDDF